MKKVSMILMLVNFDVELILLCFISVVVLLSYFLLQYNIWSAPYIQAIN